MSTKKGQWTVLSSKSVYKNPWISVKEDKVIRPDGNDGIFGVVTMKPGVSVLPFDEKGFVYLTKEYHYAVERVTIEAINGGIDDGERVLEAAKRELREEAGIKAREWIDFGFIDPFTSVINSINYIYLARGLTFTQAHPDGTEDIQIVKIPLQEAIKKVLNSEITHGATVAVILKTKHYLGI